MKTPTTPANAPVPTAIPTPPEMQKQLERLGEYQERFFKFAGDLYENIETLGNEFYNIMLADVEKTYQKGSEILKQIAELEYKAAMYEIDCRAGLITPGRRRWRFWKRNEPGEIIFREVNVDVTRAFRERTAALERLEAALDKSDSADKQTTAFDEPQQEKPGETSEKTDKKTTSQCGCTTTEPQKQEKPGNAEPATNETKAKTKPQSNGQVPGQMTLDDVQAQSEPQEPTAANTTFSAKSEKAITPPRTKKSK